MFKKLKSMIVIAAFSLGITAPAVVPAAIALAAPPTNITNGICQGLNEAASGSNSTSGCTTGTNPKDSLKDLASQVVNIFSIVVGVVAVIMIIVGGFKYITSGGESSNVSGAKNTLIYAIVGLVIVAIAQFIVHYVLNTAANANLTS